MLEYASIRRTFRWTTPATTPRIIDAAESIQTIGSHCGCRLPNADRNTRTNAANAAAFTPADMNAVTTGWRALIRIGRPHVKRHSRHLERKADQKQHDGEIGQHLVSGRLAGHHDHNPIRASCVPAMP